jgi:hypothetical protein
MLAATTRPSWPVTALRAVMHCRVAGSGDQRIGYALEIFVQFEAAFADGTFRDFRFRAAARG